MTTATMALAELAEKGADVDVLRQMVQFMAQRLMEIDVEMLRIAEMRHWPRVEQLLSCQTPRANRLWPAPTE